MKTAIEVVSATQIPNDVRAWWSETVENDPRLASPYFRPEFVELAAGVGRDVCLAMLRDGQELVGILPFQRSARRVGAPVAGIISDFQGLIARRDYPVDLRVVARVAGVSAWEFPHALSWQGAFAPYGGTRLDAPYIDTAVGFDAYSEGLKNDRSYLVRKSARKFRKLSREVGPVRFEFHVDDMRVLEQLFSWKRRRYAQTGKSDLLKEGWIPELLKKLAMTKAPGFAGVVSALYVEDRLIAAHLGMRSGTVLHWWYPAYDVDFSSHSPGVILCLEVIRQASQHGIARIDLGYGDEEWKVRFMTGSAQTCPVIVDSSALRHGVRRGVNAAKQLIRNTPLAAPVKAAVAPLRRWLSAD